MTKKSNGIILDIEETRHKFRDDSVNGIRYSTQPLLFYFTIRVLCIIRARPSVFVIIQSIICIYENTRKFTSLKRLLVAIIYR